ncbi:MAG: flavodoxin domain-containing protein [Actinobacteria bacterium]|nr:flavodoxin domain-containing protein [Actinomycetota bacterium]
MSVLVAYASKHGATGEIAERIAAGLRAAGQPADARPVQGAGDLDDYEGFVIGSAAYSTHWLRDATAFVRSNQELLAQRPVWLFSSGPLGVSSSPHGAAGTDAKATELSAAFEPREIRGFQATIHPRDHCIFSGALNLGRLSSAEWSCLKMPATRAILPEGDFRDWAQIQGWAEGIAQELTQLDALPLGGAIPCSMSTKRTSSSRWEGHPVRPVSMRRTRRMNTVGSVFVVLGLMALFVSAPLTLMLAWSSSGALIFGVKAFVLVAGLDVLMLVANWVWPCPRYVDTS